MKKLEMYCITNKVVSILDQTNYKIGWVGQKKPPNHYILCNSKNNIFYKEKYYSELTFQYWYWKNLLNLDNPNWIGFCQKRRFWLKKSYKTIPNKKLNLINEHLKAPEKEWESFDSIICEPIYINRVKKTKLLKRGFKSIIKNPSILFNEKKQTLRLHFDMHHGYGNLIKAAHLLDEVDRADFIQYINISTSFNPHIMFIAKPEIANLWFSALFPWLSRCENFFGFDDLKGYDSQRLYAYLAERYLSFWFKKHTNYLEWPWVFHDTKS